MYSGLKIISRQGFIFVEKGDRHNYSIPFPVHSLTLKNPQFDIISEHLLVGYLLTLLCIPKKSKRFRTEETLLPHGRRCDRAAVRRLYIQSR